MTNVKFFILMSVLLLSGKMCFSQHNYEGDYPEIFSGRQPSARSEALGRSFVSVTGDINSYFYNPGALATVDGLSTTFAYAKPFYLAPGGNYNFAGVSYKFKKTGVIALSRDYFGMDEVSVVNEFGELLYKYKPGLVNYRISFSREILPDFYAGINFNLLHDKGTGPLSIEKKGKNFFYADLGVLKTFNLNGSGLSHKFNLASSIINLNYSSYSFQDEIGNEIHRINLPFIFRIGAAYNVNFNGKPEVSNLTNYNLLFLTEYQNIFNAKRDYELRSGLELSLFELLSLRVGYYYKKFQECENCRDNLNEFTYGLGINIPVHKFSKTNLPLDIKFDYANMKQPGYVTDRNEWANFQVYNLKINWLIK